MNNKIQELLLQHNAIKYGNFKLQSGKQSDVYVNLRKLTLDSVSLFVLCSELVEKILELCPDVQVIGGTMSGADCIVGGVSTLMGARGKAIKSFLVRKEAKDHGLGRKIEGEDSIAPRMKAVILEDVATTGDSMNKAILAAFQMKCRVELAIACVDREEGAQKLIEAYGDTKFISLIKLSEYRKNGNDIV